MKQNIYDKLRRTIKGASATTLLVITLLCSSCGEFFELTDVDSGATFDLFSDTIVVMVGDRVKVDVKITPGLEDSIAKIYWYSDAEDMATFINDTLYAMNSGTVMIEATMLDANYTDTCWVMVLPNWLAADTVKYNYGYDMIIYANITIGEDSIPFDPSTYVVGAFCDGELRGMAVPRKEHDVSYSLIRVFGPKDWTVEEKITFSCYRRDTHTVEEFPDSIVFSTDTHGQLSDLYQLHLK